MSGLCWPAVSVVLWLWACTWMFAFYFGGFVGYLPPPLSSTQLVCPSTFLPTLRSLPTLLEFWGYVYRNPPLENTGHVRDITHMSVLNTTKNKIWLIRILHIYRFYRSPIPKYKYIESKKNNYKKILNPLLPYTHSSPFATRYFNIISVVSRDILKKSSKCATESYRVVYDFTFLNMNKNTWICKKTIFFTP